MTSSFTKFINALLGLDALESWKKPNYWKLAVKQRIFQLSRDCKILQNWDKRLTFCTVEADFKVDKVFNALLGLDAIQSSKKPKY